MTSVLFRGQIRLKHEPDAHRVSPALRHVHRRLERALQLQLRRFDRDDLKNRQLGDEHLRVLPPQDALLQIPRRAFEVQTLDVRPVRHAFRDLRRVRVLRHFRVQRGLIQRPPFIPARGLHERRGVRLGNVQPREPHHRGLAVLDPIRVLREPSLEPHHPASELLLCRRGHLRPHRGKGAVEQRGREEVQVAGHADLAGERLLKALQRGQHLQDEEVIPRELLKEHDLRRGRDPNLLLDDRHVERRGYLTQDVRGDLRDEVLAADTAALPRDPRLEVDQVGPELFRRVGVVRDVRVPVEPERLRGLHERELVDHPRVVIPRAVFGDDVVDVFVLVKVERLKRVEEEVAEVLVQVRRQNPPIERVRDAPAVHRLADEQVRDSKVRLVEVVRDVPTEFAVLASLLHDGVEKRENVRQRTEPVVRAVREVLLRDFRVRRADVQLQTVRRLRDDLQRALKDPEREPIRRVRRQPKPEDFLERFQPAWEEVAVLQHHPQPARASHLEHLRRLRTHALTERHVLELSPRAVSQIFAETEDVERRVRAGREHEHHGRERVGHGVDPRVVQVRGLDVLLAHARDDVPRHRDGDAIYADASKQEHLLEDVERVRKPAGHRRLLGGFEVVPRLPILAVLFDVIRERLERVHLRRGDFGTRRRRHRRRGFLLADFEADGDPVARLFFGGDLGYFGDLFDRLGARLATVVGFLLDDFLETLVECVAALFGCLGEFLASLAGCLGVFLGFGDGQRDRDAVLNLWLRGLLGLCGLRGLLVENFLVEEHLGDFAAVLFRGCGVRLGIGFQLLGGGLLRGGRVVLAGALLALRRAALRGGPCLGRAALGGA
eukprot:30935-Pelagococcus_subviridis.AAC.14